MRRIGSFLRLPPAQRASLLRAALVVVAIRLALWVLPFRTLMRILPRAPRAGGDGPEGAVDDATRACVRAVAKVGAHVPRASCLTRALAAQVLLARGGRGSELRFGVARGAEGLEAHAWLVRGGEVVIGDREDLARYRPLPPLPSRARG